MPKLGISDVGLANSQRKYKKDLILFCMKKGVDIIELGSKRFYRLGYSRAIDVLQDKYIFPRTLANKIVDELIENGRIRYQSALGAFDFLLLEVQEYGVVDNDNQFSKVDFKKDPDNAEWFLKFMLKFQSDMVGGAHLLPNKLKKGSGGRSDEQ